MLVTLRISRVQGTVKLQKTKMHWSQPLKTNQLEQTILLWKKTHGESTLPPKKASVIHSTSNKLHSMWVDNKTMIILLPCATLRSIIPAWVAPLSIMESIAWCSAFEHICTEMTVFYSFKKKSLLSIILKSENWIPLVTISNPLTMLTEILKK